MISNILKVKQGVLKISGKDFTPVRSVDACRGCVFESNYRYSKKSKCDYMGLCFAHKRKDKMSVIFKKEML